MKRDIKRPFSVYKVILFCFLIFLSPIAFLFGQAASTTIQQIIDTHSPKPALWSVSVRSESGDEIISLNSDWLMRPASNFKLVSSAAILDGLGDDYTYKTNIYGVGRQAGKRWIGDVIIMGSGDPSIDGYFYNDDKLAVFKSFVNQLKKRNITRITGSLIGNHFFFDDVPYPKAWDWDDLSFYYAPQLSALSFNDNCVDLEVTAGKNINVSPAISWFPFNTDYVTFENRQQVIPKGGAYQEDYRRLPGSNQIYLGSKLPQQYVEKESLTIEEPAFFFIHTLKAFLEQNGIKVEGSLALEHINRHIDKGPYTLLATHESKPMDKLVARVNKESNNFYTEMLFKTLGAEKRQAPGSTEKGIISLNNFLNRIGLDTLDIVMTDASGLSGQTLIKAGDLSYILDKMTDQPVFNSYFNSLSIGGVDGSLKYRFSNSVLKNHIYGKTGYISGVRSLSGYLKTRSGQRVSFSIITNNFSSKVKYIDVVQDRIINWIYANY